MITQPRRLKDEVYGLGGRFLDLLFPPRCVNCSQATGALCASCIQSITAITSPVCERCGRALSSTRARCPDCKSHPLKITQIRSATWHEGAMRKAIHALKYNRRRDTVPLLARYLATQLAESGLRFDLITSVPLYPLRQVERGYNQAELLARETARMTDSTYARLLERTRATADQIGLDGAGRRLNVRDAFRGNSALENHPAIVLIDDVCTTGATLDACAVALFESGARAVYGLVVARPRTAFE